MFQERLAHNLLSSEFVELTFVLITKEVNKVQTNVLLDIKNLILLLQKNKGYVCKHIPCAILKC